ncbi:hypothetical protein J23TS9_42640 [Paenibacillus sp. J23TS9]|uniref:hypothetical protein n=1 Tax=Paenibacillus sp. J23TS9 TaxID=2807193 RepID=UPI001B1A789A|nr:hypothetical protein [Paenibacillus sp. J23TS9]GIP29134.1 hypothetical protein J23TS9_42640 [Paenibacillus sp. J23TS9]
MSINFIRILQLLKNQFDTNDLTSTYKQNIWIMAAAAVPFADNHVECTPASGVAPTHTIRLVLRTTDEEGTNDYVDGTDVYVKLDQEIQIANFVWEDLWAEGPPIFHGGTIPDALRWVRDLAEPFYIQLRDPFLTPEQWIALNGHDKDFAEPQFKEDQKGDRNMIDDDLDPPF